MESKTPSCRKPLEGGVHRHNLQDGDLEMQRLKKPREATTAQWININEAHMHQDPHLAYASKTAGAESKEVASVDSKFSGSLKTIVRNP